MRQTVDISGLFDGFTGRPRSGPMSTSGQMSAPRHTVSPEQHYWLMVAFYAAHGEPAEVIAERMNAPAEAIRDYLASDTGAAVVVKMQARLFSNPKERMRAMAEYALDAQMRILLTSNDPKTLATVANAVLDRAHGKPVQVTENRNLNVNINDLDQLNKAIEVNMQRLQKLEEVEQKLLRAG